MSDDRPVPRRVQSTDAERVRRWNQMTPDEEAGQGADEEEAARTWAPFEVDPPPARLYIAPLDTARSMEPLPPLPPIGGVWS